MNQLKQRAISKAKQLRQELGGTIFAFPVEEHNQFSEYVVVMYAGGTYHIFPHTNIINDAAIGVMTALEEMKKNGYAINYEKDVRFISYESQMNAPDVTMRRLKKQTNRKPTMQESEDYYKKGVSEEDYSFSARGIIKFSYLAMVDDDLPKGAQFMNEYYKLLAMRKYGKTAAAIKQEVRRMNKDEAIGWIERTYKKYIRDDMEIFNIMQLLKEA